MASPKYSLIKKYGEIEGTRKWETLKLKYGKTKDQHIRMHGEKWWEVLRKTRQSYGLPAAIKRYGKCEGERRWQLTLQKKLHTQHQNHMSTPYKNGRTLDEYKSRYGETKGLMLWKLRNKRQSYRFSKQYYVDTYGDAEGESKWNEYKQSMNKTSRIAFITRYGKDDGIRRYKKWIASVKTTKPSMIKKYGELEGLRRYNHWLIGISTTSEANSSARYSKISQELFWKIYELLPITLQLEVKFAELNAECIIFINKWGGYPRDVMSLDFKCGTRIIEYDCSYWHKPNEDKIRDDYLASVGYRVLRIDHADYNRNKETSLNLCMEFINEQTQFKSE